MIRLSLRVMPLYNLVSKLLIQAPSLDLEGLCPLSGNSATARTAQGPSPQPDRSCS